MATCTICCLFDTVKIQIYMCNENQYAFANKKYDYEFVDRAVDTFKRKRVGQTAVSDNQSSSVTLNELAKKARKIYCNFEFQRRSHTMTEIHLNKAQITKSVRNI